jgi:Protein of unknown function (DUF3750)
MSQTSALPQVRVNRRHALAGALGGALGAALAGALGSTLGDCIEDMGPPRTAGLLPTLLIDAAVWGLAGAVSGALVGLLIGPRRGQSAAYRWPLAAAFWSALAASAEVAPAGIQAGARTFLLGMVLLPLLFAAGRWLRRGLWKARWLLLGWLLLCLVGEAYSRLWPKTFTTVKDRPDELVVQLGYSPLPSPLQPIAVHYHFLTYGPDDGEWHRWDLWQYAGAGGTSWGHVHRDLLSPSAGVGGGPPCIEHEWRGEQAQAILRILDRSAEYPYRERYLAWPGPNSNTYPAWVLRQAGVSADMDPRAIGRDYHGRAGAGRTTTSSGVQVESSLLGVKVGLEDGVELHFLCFTLGIDVWPPAIKTPLGRLGFAE